jgi:hypothetical protein
MFDAPDAINDRDAPRRLLNGGIAFMMRKFLAADNN